MFQRIKKLIKFSKTRGISFLFFCILIKSIVELIGIASITPFVSVMVNPEIIQSNEYLNYAYKYFNFENTNLFLNYLGGLTLILLLVTNITSAFVEWIIIRFSKVMEYRLSTQLMSQYLSNNYEFFLGSNSTNLGKNILAEVQRCIDGVIFPLMIACSKSVTAIFILALLIYVEPFAAIGMCLIFGGGYFLIFMFVRKRLFNLGSLSSEALSKRFQTINEAFVGVKDIKLRGIEQTFIYRYKKSAKRLAYYNIYQHVVSIMPRYILETLAFGGVVLVMLYLVNDGGNFQSIIPIIALYVFAGYKLMPALQNIYSSIVTVRFNIPALIILSDDLKGENLSIKLNIRELSEINFKESLDLKSVFFKYSQSNKYAIKNLSLSIKANSTIGIVGSTGAGKTTLVDLILGLLESNQGEINVDKKSINSKNMHLWQKKIAYMPQNVFLIDDTISANIAFGLSKNEIEFDKIVNAAKIANLHDFINTLDKGYDTSIGEQGIKLSGGERQRLGIARTIYNNPEIIVLDEGTSALDTVTEVAVMEAIKSLAKEKTIILIAHRLSTVKNCDIIYLMNNGEIEEYGSYDELIIKSKKFKSMAGKL
jgi:ATP-binding cassette, subfamily B, bacterial PglK